MDIELESKQPKYPDEGEAHLYAVKYIKMTKNIRPNQSMLIHSPEGHLPNPIEEM
jgi:hypothetical protein